MINKKYAAIFDYDGVVSDSFLAYFGWYRHVCTAFRKPFPFASPEQFRAADCAESIPARYTALDFDWEKEKDAIWAEYRAYHHAESPLFEGIQEMLTSLREHMSVGLATSNMRKKVLPALERQGIASLFDCVITCDDVPLIDGQPSLKPHPAILVRALEALNIQYAPHHAVYIGDQSMDIVASKRVQEVLCIPMRMIAATYGYMTRERLALFKPDALVDHPSEIVPAIEKIFA